MAKLDGKITINTIEMKKDELSGVITKGLEDFYSYLVTWIIIFLLVFSAFLYFQGRYDHDSTDNGDKRSGLILSIDAFTGCHYLSTGRGGITPRLNKAGRHICTGQEIKR